MKKGLAIIAGAFAAVFAVLIGAGLSGCKTEAGDKQAGEPFGAVGGMVLDVPAASEEPAEPAAGAIAFTKQIIPFSEYEENGISPQAESAYTVTATVTPESDALNTVIEWELTFENGSDRWDPSNGSGFFVWASDCISVTPYGEDAAGSKTVTVSCLRCFGEPIILTAKCKYAPELTASLRIDYAPRITSISQDYYGQLSGLNSDTKSTVHITKFNINTGTSGIPNFSGLYRVRISQYYTLEDTFTVTVDTRNGQNFNAVSSSSYVACGDGRIASGALGVTKSDMAKYLYGGVSLSFDLRTSNGGVLSYVPFNATMFDRMNFIYFTPSIFKISGSAADLATRQKCFSVNQNASNAMLSNVTLCDIRFSFTGTYSSADLWATLIVDQFVNET